MSNKDKKIIRAGIMAGGLKMCEEDKIWSRYSHDKVDIGEVLAKVIRTLNKEFPLTKKMRALSIGSSSEPQFRILETAFRGGLFLFDVDKQALGVVRERIQRQCADHVKTIHGDYKNIFLDLKNTEKFQKHKLGGKKVELVTLHHSLYYCGEYMWINIFKNVYKRILAKKGGIHAVLMASINNRHDTTTWLYNYFAGRFFGYRNDQDLCGFKKELIKNAAFKKSQILTETHYVRFFVDDFVKFMAVVWMILLYPDVHNYSLEQRREITEYMYANFWLKKRPLIQAQDHLVVYKGINFQGLI